MKQLLIKSVVALAVLMGGVSSVQAKKASLPQGRPFQLLQQRIADLDASLSTRIGNLHTQLVVLEGRVDAVDQVNTLQGQLLAALHVAIAQLEQRLVGVQASVDDLTAYNAAQDSVMAVLGSRIDQLQAQLDSASGGINQLLQQSSLQQAQINQLFQLQNAQQSAIVELNTTITFLTTQGDSQQSQISNLQSQLTGLNQQYQQTLQALAIGCSPNNSIRQVIPGGSAVCEPDSGQFFQIFSGFSNAVTVQANSFGVAEALCPVGTPQFVVTGGGHFASTNVAVVQSFQLAPSGWRVVVFNANPYVTNLHASVVCARVAPQ